LLVKATFLRGASHYSEQQLYGGLVIAIAKSVQHLLFDLFEKPHLALLRNQDKVIVLSAAFIAETNTGVLNSDALQLIERDVPLNLELGTPGPKSIQIL